MVASAGMATNYCVWQDMDDNGVKDTVIGTITEYTGAISTVAEYNWHSVSAHPVNGPSAEAFVAKAYLYSGTDGLSLIFFDDIDGDINPGGCSTLNCGSPDEIVILNITVIGSEANVQLSDDPRSPGEFREEVGDTENFFFMSHHKDNTDGGALGPLEGDTWEIWIKPQDLVIGKGVGELITCPMIPADCTNTLWGADASKDWGDNTQWKIHSGDGIILYANMNHAVIITPIPCQPIQEFPAGIFAPAMLTVFAYLAILARKKRG